MDDLFQAVRAACSPSLWSQGVELARRLAVHGVEASDEEIVCEVKEHQRPVPRVVTLYPDDEEWDCNCGGRADVCEHVAGAVIAVRKARNSGKSLPEGRDDTAHVIHRLEPHQDELALMRVVRVSDGTEIPLVGSLASAVATQRLGVSLMPSKADLDVDRALSGRENGPIPRTLVASVVKLLGGARNVEFMGEKVRIASEALRPSATIDEKADGGGFVVSLKRDPRATKVIASGVALGQDATIFLLAETEVTGTKLQQLPSQREYDETQTATLVCEVLPELKRRFHLTVNTNKLPEVSRELKPRVVLKVEQAGGSLSVIPLLVYGDPAGARVDGNRLIHLKGPIPVRDPLREQSLINRVRQHLGLSMGVHQHASGEAATALAVRLDRWEGSIEGGTGHFIRSKPVRPSLRQQAGQDLPSLGFVTDDGGSVVHASSEAVMQAYTNGLDLVPLMEGGWAPLPTDWLQEHGDLIATLLTAKSGEPGVLVQPHALPALAQLCQTLDYPAPPALEPLKRLLSKSAQLPTATLPKDLNARLRPYQKAGINWLSLLRGAGMGAVLADDMGLGKTLQTLATLSKKTLVVAPTSVVFNWASEIERFRPETTFNLFHGPNRKLDGSLITLTTYALLRREQDMLGAIQWDTVVLDEAQAIKNPHSQVSQAAFSLRARHRVALSGTPVENRLEELWSLFHFTNRGLLGGRADFQARFGDPIGRGEARPLARLQRKIAPFILRRDKRTVAPELPPKTETVLYCDLSENERKLYESVKLLTQKEVVEKLQAGANALHALEALLRLRQAACHPELVLEKTLLGSRIQAPKQPSLNTLNPALGSAESLPSSAKVRRLVSSLDGILADSQSKSKALVFSQWTSYLDLIEPELTAMGVDFLRLDGATRDRAGVVSNFQAPDGPRILLLSLKAGGTGLNLTAADHVFLMDLWWNPAVEQQAADRAHRLGQDKPVFVHRLVAKDTVEERILALQATKRELATAALDGSEATAQLSRDDLLMLLA